MAKEAPKLLKAARWMAGREYLLGERKVTILRESGPGVGNIQLKRIKKERKGTGHDTAASLYVAYKY